jgi:vacuolar iron transporter family protein
MLREPARPVPAGGVDSGVRRGELFRGGADLTTESSPGRPASGFGHYLRDLVYGALDGVITTLAVIAGAAGAHLDVRVGIILGLANLVADGLSMGASNYLGLKSELEQANHSVAAEAPWRHGLATAAAFAVVGAVPLAGYALAPALGLAVLPVAGALAAGALVGAGFVRAPFVRKPGWISAAEMLAIGGVATAAAYAVGAAAELWLR